MERISAMLRRKELEVALEQQMASMEDLLDETTLEKRLRAEKVLREKWNFNSKIEDIDDDTEEEEDDSGEDTSYQNVNYSPQALNWDRGIREGALTSVSLPRLALSKSLPAEESEESRNIDNNSEGSQIEQSIQDASKITRAKAVQFLSLRRGQTTKLKR